MRVLLLFMALAVSISAYGQPMPAPGHIDPIEIQSQGRMPGVEVAAEISALTSVPISPLLGVSALGAWEYLRATEATRSNLPWHSHPAVWGIGFSIFIIVIFKDALGAALPPIAKKPLDMMELFESQASGLLAAGVIVPATVPKLAEQILSVRGPQEAIPYAIQSASIIPFDLPSISLTLALFPLVLLVFGAVWLTSHAINILILLSPFGLIDAGLKLVKAGLLLAIAIPFLIHPMLGLGVSLLIICISFWLAPIAFRMMVFGTMMSLDVLWPWKRSIALERAHSFNFRRVESVPAWTYGRLSSASDGTFKFSYRPWLLFQRKEIILVSDAYCLGRGLLLPTLERRNGVDCESHQWSFVFLPRYRGEELDLSNELAIARIHDGVLVKGIRTIGSWLSGMYHSLRPTRKASSVEPAT